MAIVRRDGDPTPQASTQPPTGFERLDPFRLMNEMMRWEPLRAMRELAPSISGFVPAFDVRETPDSYVIEGDVPGLKEKDLEINLVGHRLSISGKRESRREEKGEQYFTCERQSGTFTRSFTLPEGVDLDHIDASVDDGVLRVTIPKTEKYKPRKIGIKERVKQALKS
jgi:HSP20 family protein